MRLSKYKKKNIFCIEGNWNTNLKDKTSIKSALDFLEHNSGVSYIHRNCSTIEQLEELLKDSTYKTYAKYGVIYLAFHGNPNIIHVGKRKKMNLDEIASILEGKARDKIIHFGSCSTLDVSGWELRRFITKTGALAISGYEDDVDFIPSTFLDILYFQFCQNYQKVGLIDRDVKKYYGALAKKLGFKMYYKK